MKLTIGMIVKNEEKWLDKCLTAIKPVLDAVDSELIITDTGSTDRTVEIAEKYTDKVMHFEWCNDFSAARNFGLEKAKGEWFMMLDADDIFRSCDNIIEFFNSGEYRKYNAASYISRNIIKVSGGDSYNDILAPRMVKLHPETRYEGVVHEALTTFAPPFKNLQDVADHYGYYYETAEDKRRKFERNNVLLLERLKTSAETDPMLYVQLYESYLTVNDKDKALYYLNKGMEISEKLNSIVLVALYFHKAAFYRTENNYDEAINVCNNYFSISKKIRPYALNTDGEIYGIKAESLYNLKKYAEAVPEYKRFFDTYRDIKSGKLATYDGYLVSGYLCSDLNMMPLYNNFIDSCIRSGRLNTADIYLSTYPIYKYSLEPNKISGLVKLTMQVAEKMSYRAIDKYYTQFDDYGKKLLTDELFYMLDRQDDKEPILKALIVPAKRSDRIKKKLDIYKAYICSSNFKTALNDYISEFGINSDVDLIYLAMKSKCDISVILKSPEIDMKKCIFLCCRNIEGFYEAAESYSAECIEDEDIIDDAAKLYDYCISMRLMDNEDKSKQEKEELIRSLHKVKSEILAQKTSTVSEFEKLASTFKNNIRSLIRAGNTEAAGKLLAEYKKLVPDDKEIPELYSQLGE